MPDAHVLGDAFRVAVLEPAEFAAPIRECNLVAGLMGKAHRCFNCAVASANDEDVVVGVVISLNEPVKYVRKFFSLHAELARGSGAAHCQNRGVGAVFRARSAHAKEASGVGLNGFDALARMNVQIGSGHDLFPEFQQVFFGKRGLAESAMEGEFDWAGHYELLARIFRDSATDFFAFEGQCFQATLGGAQRCADASRSRANDDNVKDIRAWQLWRGGAEMRSAIASMLSRPWATAFLIRARPPSSPAMKRLSTLVS